MRLPPLFIGSSVEGLAVAQAIRSNLEYDARVTVWNEGVFALSRYALEALQQVLSTSEFGVFVFTPDDVTVLRGEERPSVRDNVILELGMFFGRLGLRRTFIVQPRGIELHLPTDLLGITFATYDPARMDDARGALGSACDQIRRELGAYRPTFPTDGSFGANILADTVVRLEAGREYSLAIDVPQGLQVRVRIQAVTPIVGMVPWGMSVRGFRNIDREPPQNGGQSFNSTGFGRAELPITFRDHGQADVTVSVGAEVILDKKLEW